MTEHILDAKITKVYPGPTGESEYGQWKIYNLYLDKDDKKKFGYMQSGKKPIPKEGMEIKHIEYEIEQTKKDGKTYENYKIKKLELKEDIEPTPESTLPPSISEPTPSHTNGREVSFYVAYAKDIVIAMLQNGEDLINLQAVCSQVAKAGVKLMNESLDITKTPPQKPINAPESTKEKKSIPDIPNQGDVKTWPSKGAFVTEIKEFEEKLEEEEYNRIMKMHEVKQISKLNKDQGVNLWQDLNKSLEIQDNIPIPFDDDMPF